MANKVVLRGGAPDPNTVILTENGACCTDGDGLSGSSESTSSESGQLAVAIALRGESLATSSESGRLAIVVCLSGSSTATSSESGDLIVTRPAPVSPEIGGARGRPKTKARKMRITLSARILPTIEIRHSIVMRIDIGAKVMT